MSQIKRDIGFDALRGIAILGVVAIHATPSGYVWKETAAGVGNFWFTVFIRQFLNFSVPAFLFISGYFIAKKEISTLNEYTLFLKKRLSRVLIPYFLWSIVFITFEAIHLENINTKILVFKLCTGGAKTPFYFMLLISQYYILTPALMYINKKKYGFHTIVLINILVLFCFYVIRLYFEINIPIYLYALPAYSWIMFYQYGLLVGANPKIENNICSKSNLFILLTFIGLLLSWTEAILMLRYFESVNFATTAIKLSSYIFSFSLISLFLWFKIKVDKWNKIILLIGNYSFGIYLIHGIFLGITIYLLRRVSLVDFLQPIFQPVAILTTVSVCIVFIYISRRAITEKTSVRIFGL